MIESLGAFLRKVELSESTGDMLSPIESLRQLPWVTKFTEADKDLVQSKADLLVPFLMSILAGSFSSSDSDELRQAILEAGLLNRASAYLGQTKSKTCVPQLLAWAIGTDERLIDVSTMTLARLGDVAVSAILEVLKSEVHCGRMLQCLRHHWHPPHRDATDELAGAIVDQLLSRPQTRNESGKTLVALGVRLDADAIKLTPLLESSDAELRLFAAGALAAGGLEVHKAITIAIRGLDDQCANVRNLAAIVLERLGEDATPALPNLLSHLAEEDRYASRSIKKAIVAIGPVGIPEILLTMKSHESHIVRGRCAAVLSGPDAISAYDDLLHVALNDTNEMVKYRASRALRMILNRKDNVGYLEAILSNAKINDSGGYSWNAGPLGQRGTCLVHLWACLLSDDPAIRRETFALVEKFGLAGNRSIAKQWVTSVNGHVMSFVLEESEDILQRRLKAMSLLDELLNCQRDFLEQCAKHHSGSVRDLAEALLARIR